MQDFLPTGLKYENGSFQLGSKDLLEVAHEYDTPLYAYDANTMERKYEQLCSAFDGVDLKVKYACKSLSNQNILKLFHKWGAGLDTVSIQEVELGLRAGFQPDQIIYTPNCVSMEEIRKAVNLGVVINIDNISILEQFGNEYGGEVPICLRLNPHIMGGGNQSIATGHIDSKFGISIYQLRHVERLVGSLGIKVIGLHMHTGSDILDVDVFLQGAERLFDATRYFDDLEFVDFGSGFKVPYKDDDLQTDVEQLGKELSQRFQAFCKEYGRDLELWFEPGKFLVSEAGYFLARVNVLKTTTATVFAGVDSGFNHLIRPMFYNAYHHILNISNPNGRRRVYTVSGYICETDNFAWDRPIPEIHEGDILAFCNAGAYGNMMASNYNSRFRPAEVLIYNGQAHLIRERETLDDLLRNQVEWEL